MATKTSKSRSVRNVGEGFSTFAVFAAFVCGFMIWPVYAFLSYEITFLANGDISLKARTDLKVKTQDTAPEAQVNPSRPIPVVAPIAPDVAPTDIDARNRWLIKKAVIEYNRRYPRMRELNLFELIGKGYLKELPNCPKNQQFALTYSGDVPSVDCR